MLSHVCLCASAVFLFLIPSLSLSLFSRRIPAALLSLPLTDERVSLFFSREKRSLLLFPLSPALLPWPLTAHPLDSPGDAQVLMQKMQSISQQHKHKKGDEDRSPEELQNVFEKVEVALHAASCAAAGAAAVAAGAGNTPPKESQTQASTVLKEKDQNTLQTQQANANTVQTPVNGASPAASALPSLPLSSSVTTEAANGGAAATANANAAAVATAPLAPQPPFSARFVIDPDFTYIDFARRGANSEFTTFRVQDYS